MKNDNSGMKNGLFIGIGVVILAVAIVGFVMIYKGKGTTSSNLQSNSSSASELSSKYDDIDYGTSTDLSGTTITSGGSYKVSGKSDCITINTNKDVELVLEDAEITCANGPAIYVENAGSVSIVLNGTNTISATTTADLDGAIYSKDDLVFSGTGTLTVTSNYDGIVSKDSLLIKSGTYVIQSDDDAIRGKDNVAIVDGTFTINAKGDGIKATNDEDTTLGYVTIDGGTFDITSGNDGIEAITELVIKQGSFDITTTGNANIESSKGLKAGTLIEISGGTYDIDATDDGIHSNGDIAIDKGTFDITSKDDAIHADGLIEINGGTFTISASEGIEATYVKINDGTIEISASDDGINAGKKSTDYEVAIEINGGNITIKMGAGDTDGIDSNGNLYINGGTIDITANSPFDYDGESKYTGGTIIVNGETTNKITNQMMGGMGGGPQGAQGEQPGGPQNGMRGGNGRARQAR